MIIAQLIAELKKLPLHTMVRGYNTLIHYSDEGGEIDIRPDAIEAQSVTNVVWRGVDVVLECGGKRLDTN
jgi:hypothetical protein